MNPPTINQKFKKFPLTILLLQFIASITMILDIPVARQVICFIYFTFFPGFLIVRLLKLKNLDKLEAFLFSVGLSIASLMLVGLLVNEFGLLLGVSRPLSLLPLMVILNTILLIGVVLVYLKSEDFGIWKIESTKKSPCIFLFLCLPILSIIGAMFVNLYSKNLILLFMLVTISVLFVGGIMSKKLLPVKLYPFVVLMIAIALLYHFSLISNHFVTFGSDVISEYFVFKTVERGAFWSSSLPYEVGPLTNIGRINAMLSVTVLPTFYSSLLNMDSMWIFKILYPLIFSFVPLGLYKLWQKYFGSRFAFFSAFLFMAQETFYTEMMGLNRQIIAELFFVLLLLVVMNKEMKRAGKMVCFMIFSFAIVTSHYGLSEIFLLLFLFVLISLTVLRHPSKKITFSMGVFFCVVMFSWYIFMSRSAVFESFLEFGDYVFRQLGDFLNPEARGAAVLRGLGLEAPPTIWNMISRIFAYLTEALIVIGFLGLVTKRLKFSLDAEYFVLTLSAFGFLAALILVPGLAATMKMTRFYHVLLFFLAPLCMLGAETIVNFVSKRNVETKISFLLLVVLVPYFLFQTNFVYEMTGNDSWSVPLSGYRMNALRLRGQLGCSDVFSVLGAQWLSSNDSIGNTKIYSDFYSRREIIGYGLIYPDYIKMLSNTTKVESNGILYLNSLNVIEGILTGSIFSWNISNIDFLDSLNKIYSNGACELYQNNS